MQCVAGGCIPAFSCTRGRFLLFHLRSPTAQMLRAQAHFPTELMFAPCFQTRLSSPRTPRTLMPLCCQVPPSPAPTLQSRCFCFRPAMLYNTPLALVPFMSPNWNVPAFPAPPPRGVRPCGARRNLGHCLCQQIQEKINELLK